jgi:DDE superfamily endonuclease
MPHSDPIIEVLTAFRPLFTAPTWRKLMTLLTGTLLARGRRTVTAALRQTGHEMDLHWSGFHQVLNRARWSPLAASRCLLQLIVETFVQAGGSVDLVIDETLERRWGPSITKRGHYRDSALSSRKRAVSSPGLRWIVMAVVVSPPWTKQRWALPFLAVLAPTPAVSASLGKRHKTVCQWARQMVLMVRRWLPDVPLNLLGDTTYSALELGLTCRKLEVTQMGPLALDAALYALPPARTTHTLGRPRVVGNRLPSLQSVLQDPATTWQRHTFDWYGQGERSLDLCTGTALWYHAGLAPLPLRWVLTRDPQGAHPAKAFFSLNQSQLPQQIVAEFMKRWSLEATYEESRAHLGMETQRQWSDAAIERTTPLLFGLYSLVALFAHALSPSGQLHARPSAWYRKSTPTFSDALALVRRHLWGNFLFPISPTDPQVVLLPRSLLDRLEIAVCY